LKNCFLVRKAERGDQISMAQITLHDYLQETEDAISSNHFDDALAHCQLMLSYFPQALEIHRLLGEVYLAQGQLEDAQHIFDWVLANDPENVVAYCNRADVSERMAEYDVALDCYQQAYELSRGNGQIREEFNRLSEKVGQKGFMFSRAGLARLYMRGDSLSEAIQEWDAVLTVAPDRLDARTGLLETYWRAGLQENVEQLAEQILHNVPGCLKALLLQASVISAKESQRSQELLRRAEALDPDHTIAQALFADALASHPDDPFLRQLKKAPVLLPEAKETTSPAQPLGPKRSSSASASDPVNSLPNTSPSTSNSPTHQAFWNAPVQEVNHTQFSQKTHTGSLEHSPEPWELLQNALNQLDTTGEEPLADQVSPMVPTSSMAPATPYEDSPLWERMPSSVESSQTGLDVSPSASLLMPKQQKSGSLSGMGADLWGVSTEEPIPPTAEDVPPTPTWLNILAQTDVTTRRGDPSAPTPDFQLDNGLLPTSSSLGQLAQSNATSSEAQNMESFLSSTPLQPSPLTTSTEKAESQPSWSQSADGEKLKEDEESFFSPSWLKSLGATTLAEEEYPATTASADEAQTPYVAQPEYTDPQQEEDYNTPLSQYSQDALQVPSTEYTETQPAYSHGSVPEPNPYEPWSQVNLYNSQNIHEPTSWTSSEVAQQSQSTNYETSSLHENAYTSDASLPLSSVDLPVEQPVQWKTIDEKAEQNLTTTLEELEQSLRSKGFIPLEPNSLSTLASQVDTLQVPEEYNAQDFQQATFKQEPQQPEETPGAPSLSSALAQLGSFVKEPPSPTEAPLASSFKTLEENNEPSWLQALKHSPATPAVPATPTWPDTSIEPSTPAAYADNLLQTPPVQVEPTTTISHDLTQPVTQEIQQTKKNPVLPVNPLFDPDGELETTMRRPAVRLQPMQQRSSPSPRIRESHIVSRSQSEERIEKTARVTRPTNENLSYRERLVKGYQYQLIGDYDEAMQEYRIIVRSGTDLLNEVVSNVRALLKLAPNYSPGYRVLGDAYMRQGEYLQAMEAYNKALTMTKKVKSRA
jgi:tetratricopeptide (TPR) repeat protein